MSDDAPVATAPSSCVVSTATGQVAATRANRGPSGMLAIEDADTYTQPQGEGRGTKRRGSTRAHEVGADGLLTQNRQGVGLCRGFQTGACKSVRGSIKCPANSRDSHQCGKCLSPSHGAHHPHERTAEVKKPPVKPQGGKGRGKQRKGKSSA